jgi:hypothetical protein
MKTIRRFALVPMLLLGLLSMTVVPFAAQAEDLRGRFTLTSETLWGDVKLPAGEYTYSLATRSSMPVILLRSVDGTEAAFIAANAVTEAVPMASNALTIEKVNGVNVVVALHVSDARTVLHYSSPKSLIESAAKSDDAKLMAAIGKK